MTTEQEQREGADAASSTAEETDIGGRGSRLEGLAAEAADAAASMAAQARERLSGAAGGLMTDEVNIVRGALGATSRIVAQAASILEEEIAAGIVAARRVEEKLIDVRSIRGSNSQEVMQRFRRDAHDVVDILIDLVNLTTNSLSGLTQRAIRISEGSGGGAGGGNKVRASSNAIPALDVGHPVHPGESVELPLTLENDGDKPTESFQFVCSDLVTAAGGRIVGSYVSFNPSSLVIAPRSSERVTINLNVPTGTPAGVYSGILQASQLQQLRAVLSVSIVS